MQLTVKLQILQFIFQLIIGAGLLIQGYFLIKQGK
jgi:hypothetical protein